MSEPTITDVDRRAVSAYMVERARLAFNGTTEPHADLLLKMFARHREAARREALEEAAKVADDHDTFDYDTAISEVIAEAIRALIDQTQEQPAP